MDFFRKQPCNNCPYRKDAPLQHWHQEEFKKLQEENTMQFGKVYGCHKNDGHICVGYLMLQDQNNLPNINLRMVLLKNNVTRVYLNNLFCKSPLFNSIEEMIQANFPEICRNPNNK